MEKNDIISRINKLEKMYEKLSMEVELLIHCVNGLYEDTYTQDSNDDSCANSEDCVGCKNLCCENDLDEDDITTEDLKKVLDEIESYLNKFKC